MDVRCTQGASPQVPAMSWICIVLAASLIPVALIRASERTADLNQTSSPEVSRPAVAPVQFPQDLVDAIAARDPELSRWLENWQRRRPAGAQELEELTGLLRKTVLSSDQLCRTTRQIDRGRDYIAASLFAAAAVDRAHAEMDAGHTPNIRMLLLIRPFISSEASGKALEKWGNLLARLPPYMQSADLQATAQLALAAGKLKQGQDEQALVLARQIEQAVSQGKLHLSAEQRVQLDTLLADIDDRQGRSAAALARYEEIEKHASYCSIIILAKLGRKEEACRRAADYAQRYQLSQADIEELALQIHQASGNW